MPEWANRIDTYQSAILSHGEAEKRVEIKAIYEKSFKMIIWTTINCHVMVVKGGGKVHGPIRTGTWDLLQASQEHIFIKICNLINRI